jgi:DnaK suppressor protein
MNMTSDSPFDTQVLPQFEASLQRQQGELRHLIENTDKEIRALANQGPLDAIDLACGNSLKESMFAHCSQVRRQLRLVELALERIRKGEFGICAACEGVIALKRLEAVPWAKHCIGCQERFEHARRHVPMVELCSGDAAQR